MSDNPTAQRWLRVSINGTAINLDAHEHATPSWGAGQRSWCWAPTSEQVAFVRNEGGFARICIASVETGVVSELGKAWHLGLSWSRTPEGRSRIAAIRSGGVTPQQLVVYELFDREPPSRTTVARGPVGGWEAFRLPEPEVVTWSAVDGTALHGRLYVPRSTGSKKAPVVVAIHGGPTDQATVQFTTRYAYFLGLGWAVFVPDHRGSSGHGREFQQAMNGRWGELDVADVLSGITWLKSRVDVDADIVVLNGGSAGGFTVLHLLAQATEDSPIRGGIALYPVTDLAALDATTHRFERHYSATIVGPTSVYTQRSPVTYAARVKLPLLLLHGDADKVVSVQQSRDLVASIKANGGNVTYVEYADEGHGWRKPETTRNELEQIAEFLSLIAD